MTAQELWQLAAQLRQQADTEESKARRQPNISTYCLGVRWGLILAARELEQAVQKEQGR